MPISNSVAKLNELSIHIVNGKQYIAGHENVENPRKNSRAGKGMDAISRNVIMHVCKHGAGFLCVQFTLWNETKNSLTIGDGACGTENALLFTEVLLKMPLQFGL